MHFHLQRHAYEHIQLFHRKTRLHFLYAFFSNIARRRQWPSINSGTPSSAKFSSDYFPPFSHFGVHFVYPPLQLTPSRLAATRTLYTCFPADFISVFVYFFPIPIDSINTKRTCICAFGLYNKYRVYVPIRYGKSYGPLCRWRARRFMICPTQLYTRIVNLRRRLFPFFPRTYLLFV